MTDTEQKPRRGRPPKTQGGLDIQVATSLSQQQYARLMAHLETSGETQASFIRRVILAALPQN